MLKFLNTIKLFTLIILVIGIAALNVQAQNWDQIIKVTASDRAAGDEFGFSVSLSGDYAIVGAYQEDENASGGANASNAGSAYIFKNVNGTWTQVQKIVASDRAAADFFGISVSISGDYAIVGAYGEDENASGGATANAAGSAYIFKNTAGTWAQVQKIVASDRAALDQFGISVSISGDYAIVGANQEDENASGGAFASDAGSAYIFKNTAGTWTQVQKIVASDRASIDFFGYSVSLSGDYAIVGAYEEDEDASGGANANDAGSAYIFKKDQGGVDNWGQVQKIVASDRAEFDRFGYSVSLSGDYAIVGAYAEDEDASGGANVINAGSAYIFKKDQGGVDNWGQVQKIVASDRAILDRFGVSVSISGDYAIVGAYQEDQDASGGATAPEAGSAYIFKNTAGTWTQVQKIVASDRAAGDLFGWSVSISGVHAIVGAVLEDQDASGGATATDAGSAYIFTTVPAEINLKQNTTNIASGGNYDFGNVNINASSSDISFTIENTGVQNLTITGTAGSLVVLGGTNASEFSVVQSSVTSPITGGSNKAFTVKFSPTSAGAKTAALTITNNDLDEGTYTVNLTGTGTKINQTITFGTLTAKTVGDANFDLTATASSGLAVSYASSNTAVATISGKTVTLVGAGTTEITASQAGNGTYNAATDVKQTLTVNAASSGGGGSDTPITPTITDLQMPNVFTPNGDGTNDIFNVLLITAPSEIDFKVLDTKNNIVYETQNPQEAITSGWDGTFRDKAMPNGRYVWFVKYKNANGESKEHKGYVVLAR